MRKMYKLLTPAQVLLASLITAIVVGTILLKLPIATTEPIAWIDALFTTVSAISVTGLIVVDTGTVFTIFGQLVILLLVQLGGIGIMTFAVLVFILLGRKVFFRQRMWVQQALNQSKQGGVVRLVKRIIMYSLVVESIAFVFLSANWVPQFGWRSGLYASLFHTISAFNNAGFSIWSDNLTSVASDPIANVTISLLFIIGGLGFTVMVDVWNSKSFREMSLHTKIMLVSTLTINVLVFLIVFLVEYKNPNTLGPMSFGEKTLAAYFQAVTPRTAGFNTVDIASLDHATLSLYVLLMFVGAGSTSTGGGIKLTTFFAIASTAFMFFGNRHEIIVFRRTLPQSVIIRSIAVTFIASAFIFIAVFILDLTEEAPFLMILFEVVSAFGTVGLSMGLTSELTSIGKLIIIIMMFVGKVGPLTLAYAIAKKEPTQISYPKEDIFIG
ncbi:TrkH family potassium uptake protein [Bacillus solimangrovi]|uniref:Ktr system potassium transporter B n=1 Tax=Bacillus solimangrovi TaxID=1305675 RepID=A0A1E5LEE3_9BACI|nr:TrkH family potassium uptake protein [Bacillus solimangrovi]OEH92443.1 Ktr system potassium transporter B [Bacillus solimangrovi]